MTTVYTPVTLAPLDDEGFISVTTAAALSSHPATVILDLVKRGWISTRRAPHGCGVLVDREDITHRLRSDRLSGCAAATRVLTDWNMSRYIIT